MGSFRNFDIPRERAWNRNNDTLKLYYIEIMLLIVYFLSSISGNCQLPPSAPITVLLFGHKIQKRLDIQLGTLNGNVIGFEESNVFDIQVGFGLLSGAVPTITINGDILHKGIGDVNTLAGQIFIDGRGEHEGGTIMINGNVTNESVGEISLIAFSGPQTAIIITGNVEAKGFDWVRAVSWGWLGASALTFALSYA